MVPVVDEVKGQVPEVYFSLKPGILPNKQVHEEVTFPIEAILGKMARPDRIHVVPYMPKTRSGKIMRRVLAAISNRMDRGSISTRANPGIAEQVLQLVQGRAVGQLREGPGDSKRFGDQR